MKKDSLEKSLYWVAATVKQEAEREGFNGKLAVAWVIKNRMTTRRQNAATVVLSRYQFSCWNSDSPTRMRLSGIPKDMWFDCYKAACGALFDLTPDPTKGATHYLNKELTVHLYGKLPKYVLQVGLGTERVKLSHLIRSLNLGGSRRGKPVNRLRLQPRRESEPPPQQN